MFATPSTAPTSAFQPKERLAFGPEIVSGDQDVFATNYETTGPVGGRAAVAENTDLGQGWPILGPVLALLVITAVFHFTLVDIQISSLFYDVNSKTWPANNSAIWRSIYRFGIYPPFLILIVATSFVTAPIVEYMVRAATGIRVTWPWDWVVKLVAGRETKPPEVRYASPHWQGLFLILVILVGPCLLVERGFKEFWGRPRPREIKEFGGDHLFVSPAIPSLSVGGNSSFPSGHAAIAFYAMSPAFLCRRRKYAMRWLTFGVMYGLLMSLVRVMQGGHFTSDVLWSGGIDYLCCAILARVMHVGQNEQGLDSTGRGG